MLQPACKLMLNGLRTAFTHARTTTSNPAYVRPTLSHPGMPQYRQSQIVTAGMVQAYSHHVNSSCMNGFKEQPAIQRLVHTAQELLKPDTQPSEEHIKLLRNIAGSVPLTELGFPEGLVEDPELVITHLQESEGPLHPFLKGHVTYLHIFESAAFSLGIFMLPKGTSIPLHNHPGMSVISHLMFGQLQLTAYDLLTPAEAASLPIDTETAAMIRELGKQHSKQQGGSMFQRMASNVRQHFNGGNGIAVGSEWQPARLQKHIVAKAPTDTLVLHPDSCNIHEFVAVEHCAVLDLLTPPYDPAGGRDCTYFTAHPLIGSKNVKDSQRGDVHLLEVVRSDFYTKNARYRGVPPQ